MIVAVVLGWFIWVGLGLVTMLMMARFRDPGPWDDDETVTAVMLVGAGPVWLVLIGVSVVSDLVGLSAWWRRWAHIDPPHDVGAEQVKK